MKIGDLVKHAPKPHTKAFKIYEKCGYKRDFKTGIIIDIKSDFAQVIPNSVNRRPGWYLFEEIEVISESR
jgi:uncharacterized membrane protein